jgi:hypothetical protein
MQTTKYSAMGVFNNLDKAEKTVDQLRRAGFPSAQIGIIGHVEGQPIPTPLGMRTPEDNATNSVLRGGILGALIGVIVSAVIPGLGELSGLGTWFEILGGAVLGGSVGGVILAFGSLLFSRPNSRLVARELESGHVIVTVTSPDRNDEAVSVLRREADMVNSGRETVAE